MDKTQNPEGFTAIHVACKLDAPSLLPFLVAGGIDPNQPTNSGLLPLEIAVSKGKILFHNSLLDFFLVLYHLYLYLTDALGREACIAALLKLGANPNLTNPEGITE